MITIGILIFTRPSDTDSYTYSEFLQCKSKW